MVNSKALDEALAVLKAAQAKTAAKKTAKKKLATSVLDDGHINQATLKEIEKTKKKPAAAKKKKKKKASAKSPVRETIVKKMGRPVKYETVDQMESIIDRYFDECFVNAFGTNLDSGELPKGYLFMTEDKQPTVTGLAWCLDLTRQGLIEYEAKTDFSDTIKRAKTRIEASLEQRLFGSTVAGVIFNLKNNYHWQDKIDHTVGGSEENSTPVPIMFVDPPVRTD